jgi:uncharacterized membrane protein YraQ (UPF0718 family)
VKKLLFPLFLAVYGVFVAVSFLTGFEPGEGMAANFADFALQMLRILPCAFILIGLFDVWVSRETVMKHLGEGSSKLRAYFWVFLLAGTTVGGLYVALPVAWAIYRKGARTQVVLGYIGAAAIVRIPMAVFEASFLGIRFTLVRLVLSIPLVIVSSEILGAYLNRHGWVMNHPEREEDPA